jgi:hypothetical protein
MLHYSLLMCALAATRHSSTRLLLLRGGLGVTTVTRVRNVRGAHAVAGLG